MSIPFGRNRVRLRSGGIIPPVEPPPDPIPDVTLSDWIYYVDFTETSAALTGTTIVRPGGTGGYSTQYVDTTSKLSVNANEGVLNVAGGNALSDPRQDLLPSIARAAGLCYYCRAMSTMSTTNEYWLGWDINQTGAISEAAVRIQNGTELRMLGNNSNEHPRFSGYVRVGEWYEHLIILRATGYWYYIRGGDLYPVWTLIWVDEVRGAATPLFPAWANLSASFKIGAMGIKQLGAPFTTDHGPAEESSSTNGEIFDLGKADQLLTGLWTPTANGQEFNFYARRLDDDNNIHILVNCGTRGVADSGTIRVFRRVAGVATELGSVQTWTSRATGANQIVAILSDDNIKTVAQYDTNGQAVKHNLTERMYMSEFRSKAFWSGTATFAQYTPRIT